MKKIEAYKRMMQYILALVNFGVLLAIFMYYEVEYYSYYMTDWVDLAINMNTEYELKIARSFFL